VLLPREFVIHWLCFAILPVKTAADTTTKRLPNLTGKNGCFSKKELLMLNPNPDKPEPVRIN